MPMFPSQPSCSGPRSAGSSIGRRIVSIAIVVTMSILIAGCSSSDTTATTSTDPVASAPGATQESSEPIEFSVRAHGVDADQFFRTTGAAGERRYGNGRLTGTTTIDGRPAQAELLAQVDYVDGSGPFVGFWTFTLGDASSLVLSYAGEATRSGTDTMITGDLRVLGGTGTFATATGGGTLRGERTTQLGGDVDYHFTLHLAGLPAGETPSDRD